ncbi:MAG: hypothetical protein ACI861_000603 [Paracoccaceae bacterium]|jgi:hypothetical protein
MDDRETIVHSLREIGWSLWDPIGLNTTPDGWQGQHFEADYDTYLVTAAGMLRNGVPSAEVVDYLFWIESKHMGKDDPALADQIREKLQIVVQAILDHPEILGNMEN